MKTATLVSALAALVMPTLAVADPISVRSGEHDRFTRLVMRLPDNVTWRLEDGTRKSTLTIVGFDQGFDLSRAFEIIPKTRLAALLSNSASLEMQLNCDCRVVGFVEGGEFLVVDIIDADPDAPEIEEAPATLALPNSQFSFGELLWAAPDFPETPVSEPSAAPEPQAAETQAPENTAPELEDALERVQEQLVEAFSDAAAKGLVDPKITEPTMEEPDIFTETVLAETEPEPVPGQEPAELPLDAPRTNIKITSSKDLPSAAQDDLVGLSGITCPDANIVDVASWSNGDDFNTQRIQSNLELYDELGRLQSDKIVKRAKMFLHFGMGAEALQALNMNPKTAAKYPELIDLAQYFEHGFIRNPRVLHRFADCNSDLALWGILSAKDLPPEKQVNTQAALRGLEELPGHLKYFVAEDLSAILVKRGELDSATVAIRSFKRLPENKNSPPKLVDATVEILRQEDQSARQILEGIIAEGSAQSPFALAELIDLDIRSDAVISPDIALLAETYAFELKNTPEGATLLRAHVLASARTAQFQKAFEILEAEGNKLRDDIQRELLNFIFLEATNTARDADFLTYYFERLPDIANWFKAETIFEISNRLLDLGFANEAGRLLERAPPEMETERAKLLGAKILFEQGEFEQSILRLEGMETVAAAALRAAALEETGNEEAAVQYYRDADQPEQAVTAIWLSEDWSTQMDSQHPVFGPVAQVSSENIGDLASSDQMLTQTQAAIDESGAARKTLEELLEKVVLPD